MNNLRDLYVEQLRDIYDAEKQLVDALPKMVEAASSTRLQQTFNNHLDQTKQHIQRLEEVFTRMDLDPTGKTCEGMKGLIKEDEQIIKKRSDADVKDAALISAAQHIEHYEIASYGTICTYAEQLNETETLNTLRKTLAEEKNTDRTLSELAEEQINLRAESH
ncbi:MAG: ferritin-like domain-containing protein [Chloroflexi bacterium]|nr:ferritin-like domain-containing protein [Chloroflexota bacterium]